MKDLQSKDYEVIIKDNKEILNGIIQKYEGL